MKHIISTFFSNVLYVNGNNVLNEFNDNFTSSDLLVLKIYFFQSRFIERIDKAYFSIRYQNGIKGFDLTATVINCNDLSNATSIRNALEVAKLDTNNIIDKKAVSPHSLSEVYNTIYFDITKYFSLNDSQNIELTVVIENNYQSYSSKDDKKFILCPNVFDYSITELETNKLILNTNNGYVNIISGFYRHVLNFNEIFSDELNIPFSLCNFINRDIDIFSQQ